MRPLTAALCVIALETAAAGEDEVPPQLALTLMLKVLTYDGEFERHPQGDFLVLVAGEPEHCRPVLDAAAQLEARTILKRKLTFVQVAPADVEKKLAGAGAVLAPRGSSLETGSQLARLATEAHVYTLAMDPKLVDAGIMLSVTLTAGKPQPVLNVGAARAVGADFKSSVLKIARTVQ